MIAMLEQPAIRRQVQPLTVETYHRLGELGLLSEKVELLRGVIVQKMSKSPIHCAVLQRLLKLLRPACKPEYEVRQEQPLTLADSEPEPDIAIVPVSTEDYASHHPNSALLVVEIAVTTVETDREKGMIFAEAGIPEFWLVLPEKRQVEVYSKPSARGYGECDKLGMGDSLTSPVLQDSKIEITRLF
jgi:Uma2 family endonuclease